MVRVEINPQLLLWALERKGSDEVPSRFPKLDDWVEKKIKPTLKQLERFANATNTPIGYFFLEGPPHEEVPIPDFRTPGNRKMKNPSPDLLDTIFLCQQRQEWFREYAVLNRMDPLDFVGSVGIGSDVIEVAGRIRDHISFNVEERKGIPTWEEALRRFITDVESSGILVMVSSVVKNNNHRKLKLEEFRGFSLVDDLAPLIFVNGSDSKSAQMFTLAHELAHIWTGKEGISDIGAGDTDIDGVEEWCNRCAAEILVPEKLIMESFENGNDLHDEIDRLAREFKVSTLVILRRIFDIGGLDRKSFHDLYEKQYSRLMKITGGQGGDFYRTQSVRAGKRFTKALISSTLEGQTLYKDAFDLLGFSKLSTFEELGRRLEVG